MNKAREPDLGEERFVKTVIIHGQSHKGSTYHIAHELAEKLGGEVTEFFLPRDFGEFCLGCTNCFVDSEKKCPHYDSLSPITQAMDASDVIILASPVYVFHATGAMKAFLDHYGYRWMVHSPEGSMFRKQGVCIATAAGAGVKFTLKDMSHSLFFWGVARIYQYGLGIAATDWDDVSTKKKAAIGKKTTAIANRIASQDGRVRPGIKTRGIFYIMRIIQKKGWNKRDTKYWNEQGWTGKTRPWK